MLLKFLKPGAHNEPGSLKYILENDTARVVRGNPEITQWVIDQTPSGLRQRFVSGVVNDLASLDGNHDDVLLDELEGMFLARKPASAMPWCVIEHTDKGKREFHFVIPKFDLLFGKSFYPYVDHIDRHAFQAWVEHFALRYNLEFPNENLRVRPAFEHMRNLRKCDREFLEKIWNQVHLWVKFGNVACRTDLERRLIKEGYKVRFSKHAGGPLQQPVILGPDGKSLRLSNSIYYNPDFTPRAKEPLDRNDKIAVSTRLAELEVVLANWHEFRAFNLIGRLFGKAQQRDLALGEAKRRLIRLMDERLALERKVEERAARIDFNALFASAHFEQSVLDLSNVMKLTKEDPIPKPVGMDEKQASPLCGKSIAPVGKVADEVSPETEDKAVPEAFQPLAPGGIQTSAGVTDTPPESAEKTLHSKQPKIRLPSGMEDI